MLAGTMGTSFGLGKCLDQQSLLQWMKSLKDVSCVAGCDENCITMVFLSTQRAEDHYPELSQLGMSFSESSPFLFKFNPLTAMMSPGKMEMTPKSNI